ncbi:hypothetical protein ACS0TY_022644 [Phlomoides rotata]
MATEVLPPQELLGERFSRPATSFNRLSTLPANGTLAMKRNQQGKPSPRNDKKRSKAAPAGKKPIHGGAPTDRHRKGDITSGGGLTMGQVTLLKRGESLSSIASGIPKSSPPQKIVPKKNAPAPAADMLYAGSCISPPSPRSLPLPSFFNKKVQANSSEEDGATMFLRRVLRLD